MQKILNNEERNQAFLKFLLFFLITIVLVVSAIFFNYRLPSKENKLLSDEVDIQRQQETNQIKFVGRLDDVNQLLDSLRKYPANFDVLSAQIAGHLAELTDLQLKDNTPYGKLDKAIVGNVSELLDVRKELYPLLQANAKVSELQKELDQCKASLPSPNANPR